MLKIGLTGGIGSGKSVVAKIFQNLGVPVYDADSKAKYLLEHHVELKSQIINLLGSEAYIEGKYNNVWISKLVFAQPDLLQKLNALVHPAVYTDFLNWTKSLTQHKFVIRESALISKNHDLDKIIVVFSPLELRIQRILARDPHRSKEQVLKIIDNQKTESEFQSLADYSIQNNEEDFLIQQVLEIKRQLELLL